jgi:hypothetical protein
MILFYNQDISPFKYIYFVILLYKQSRIDNNYFFYMDIHKNHQLRQYVYKGY